MLHWEGIGPTLRPRLLNPTSGHQPRTTLAFFGALCSPPPSIPMPSADSAHPTPVAPFENSVWPRGKSFLHSPSSMYASELRVGWHWPSTDCEVAHPDPTDLSETKVKDGRASLHYHCSPQRLVYHVSFLLNPGLDLMILRKKPYQKAPGKSNPILTTRSPPPAPGSSDFPLSHQSPTLQGWPEGPEKTLSLICTSHLPVIIKRTIIMGILNPC